MVKKTMKKKAVKAKKAVSKRKSKKTTRKGPKKIQLKKVKQASQVVVENAKFYPPNPQIQPVKKDAPDELPNKYGQDNITLMVRDPFWLYAWWEVADTTIARFEAEFINDFWLAKKVLRIYDVTLINFNGANAHRYFDIDAGSFIGSWYIETGGPGRSWCVDIGLKFPSGKFITILRSNTVLTPLDGPSGVTDEEWMIPDYMFARLYGMGFGFGKSSPVGKGWQEKYKHILSSGISSGASSAGIKK